MNPYQLIGKPYRLGARIKKHGATDCVGLCIEVMNYYGFPPPLPQRSWYRRLRKGDDSIFMEQLKIWGEVTSSPRLGCIALCRSENGYGLAVWFEQGWLSFVGSAVKWSPIGGLLVEGCFYPRK